VQEVAFEEETGGAQYVSIVVNDEDFSGFG
jgi:hypothetical protein